MKLKCLLISIALVSGLTCANIASAAGRFIEAGRARKKIEQTVAVEPNVIVSLCIASGSITVRGWERNEVQASSGDAEAIELRRATATANGPASRIEVLIADHADGTRTRAGSCSAFSDIELNVPRGAIVQLQTRDGDINVSEVAEARVETQNGDIDLQKVSRLVEAKCLSGDISLRDSSGRIVMGSVSGSVEATNVRSITAGDDFDAGTVSGDVMLDRVSHAQVHARSVSGSLNMTGPLAHGGRYDFKTMSGDVTLAMPADSSFKVNAKVAHGGEIISDFTITPTEDAIQPRRGRMSPPPPPNTLPTPNTVPSPRPSPSARASVSVEATPPLPDSHGTERLNGIFGTGDATLNLASFSGTVHLLRRR